MYSFLARRRILEAERQRGRFRCRTGIGTPGSPSSCTDALKSNQTGVRRHEAHAPVAASSFVTCSLQTELLTPATAGTTQQFSRFRIPHVLLPAAVVIFGRHFRFISRKGFLLLCLFIFFFLFFKRRTRSVPLSNPDPLQRHAAWSGRILPNINRWTPAPPDSISHLVEGGAPSANQRAREPRVTVTSARATPSLHMRGFAFFR